MEMPTVPEENATNISPALDFPISLPQNPGADFQVNGSLSSTDISSFELESGWISWLTGDDFDLDAVNTSLLQATTGDLLPVVQMPDDDPLTTGASFGPQAADVGSTPCGDAISDKWHTHCGQTSSVNITPDPAIDPNQIDESYRNELADRLQQRVQTGILPSTTFLVRPFPFIFVC